MKITVETIVNAPIERVWQAWNSPEDITHWNFASEDWQCPSAMVDLREGGTYSSRMEAKDGSMGFDFEGTYSEVVTHKRIVSTFGGRELVVEFVQLENGVMVRETFDAEETHSAELQQAGWQAILDNFAKHVEGR